MFMLVVMFRSKIAIIAFFLAISSLVCRGQFLDSASGLLQAPSAEMSPTGTVMMTANLLNRHSTPPAWGYNTLGYGVSIVFLSRVEIGYVAALLYNEHHTVMDEDGELKVYVLKNQDRHFYAKFQLLKEGEFGISWIPALAVGTSDPTSAERAEIVDDSKFDVGGTGNGYFNRYYVVATKHFPTPVGTLGVHLGYQYNLRSDLHYNGPCAAIDWKPVWLQRENIVALKLIAEYDARTFNLGFITSLWKDHIDVMVDLQALKWLSAGVRLKTILK